MAVTNDILPFHEPPGNTLADYDYHRRTVDISEVRRQVVHAIERARTRAQQRRQQAADAERAYAVFLDDVAVPVARMVASALKAEGVPFTVSTPSGGLRLSSDHGRDDYIEFGLQHAGSGASVVGRVRRARGSRTLEEERAVKPGVPPQDLSAADVLAFLTDALEPWLER